MELCGLLRKFFITGANLNKKIDVGEYLSRLSDNPEKNYNIFEWYTRECSNTMLCIMHKLGHCGGDRRLEEIISRHMIVRECFNHEEDDAGGHILDYYRRTRSGSERGKHSYLKLHVKIRFILLLNCNIYFIAENRPTVIVRPNQRQMRRRAEEEAEGVPARKLGNNKN